MSNSINWFEIPVVDMARAQKFYESVLATPLKVHGNMAIFPGDGAGGCLIKREGSVPSKEGARLYLNAAGHLDAIVERVEKAGGTLVMPKTDISPNGWMALLVDTEGNSVGLHQEA